MAARNSVAFKFLPGHPDKLFFAMATIEKALNR
jgi:hypothetical protein